MFVGLLLALSAVGIDLTALSVLGGAVGVGIGLGLQKLAANYVSLALSSWQSAACVLATPCKSITFNGVHYPDQRALHGHSLCCRGVSRLFPTKC
jgi:hypothetical protein